MSAENLHVDGCGKPWGLCDCEPRPDGKQAWIDKHMAAAHDLAVKSEEGALGCLLCGGEVSEPEDLAPAKTWWPPMVTCTNEDCIAFGIHVAADPDEMKLAAFANPDATEPKFAHSGTDRWFVSTIYRRSSAMDSPAAPTASDGSMRV